MVTHMGMSRRKLFGFLAAAPVVAPVLVAQALKADIVDPPLITVGDAVYDETNLYSGSIVWTDPDYDERTGEVLRPIRMPWPSPTT